MSIKLPQRGVSLIELIMFIVIIGVAVTGILLVMNITTRSSADPLVHKQALAIAESLLEEVELMPFTFCDPDDPAAATAASTVACTQVENIGPEAAYAFQAVNETRYGPSPFDNVNDYSGFAMDGGTGGIMDVNGVPITGLGGYAAAVAVAEVGISSAGTSPAIPAAAALLVTVMVTGPDGIPVVLEGYRTRFAPNSP